jgi:uracil-DNA glycosylase family 4
MTRTNTAAFNPDCRLCPRLSQFLDEVGEEYPDYHARPVAPFGVKSPDLLIVGLAPGMHGANATGRPFTGDYAGILLYETLYEFGFSNQPDSVARNDGLKLKGCRITNAVKCLPPQNKPVGEEIKTCNRYLEVELNTLKDNAVVLALGSIAHQAVLRALGQKQKDFAFGHGAQHRLHMLDSYHCSRYNTQTKRLTPDMFKAVFDQARSLIDSQ